MTLIVWYPELKAAHLICVAASGVLFALRGWWRLSGSPMLARPWVKVVPHLIDTVLLVSALLLAAALHQYPFVNDWLTAKVFALLAYIALGSIALKRARTRPAIVLSLIAALGAFGYIVAVARTHSPWPF